MPDVEPIRLRAELDADRNIAEFIRHCREDLTWLADHAGFDWDAPVWPRVRWAKESVGKRGTFNDDERLDPEFIDFAKAYFRWKGAERGVKPTWVGQALRCLEAALLTVTKSGSVQGLSLAVLDEAAVVARGRFTKPVQYHVGRNISDVARFVSKRRLVPVDVSTWASPFQRPSSVHRTGKAGQAEIDSKMPSNAGLDAMAEVFANDPDDPIERFISSVWALLMSAPWRISEVLRLHVGAEYEDTDDDGVVSYGLRYYGAKGWEHDVKWVPKTMEPVAREAFRRIKEMTESARALAKHLETKPDVPFLYPDAPQVEIDDVLTLEEKAAYLRCPVPMVLWDTNSKWNWRSITECWARARAKLPQNFPVFDGQTRLKWSEALFCIHRNFTHASHPTDWYGLTATASHTVTSHLNPRGTRKGMLWAAGYREPDGKPIYLTPHMARHYVSTAAERGNMAQEDLAKWAGRAALKGNRVYNHMSEEERVERARALLAGTELAGQSTSPQIKNPTTPAEFNLRAKGPTHRTLWGVCEQDWTNGVCTKHGDCVNCSEHAYTKGDHEAYARLKAQCEYLLSECEKALVAIQAGTSVADRWLEHALKSLIGLLPLVSLLESDDIEDGTKIRLTDDSAEHSHLRRALNQRLPQLRDPSLPAGIKALIGRYINGETLVDAAGGRDRQDSGRLACRHQAHLGRTDQADREEDADSANQTDTRTAGEHQSRIRNPKSRVA